MVPLFKELITYKLKGHFLTSEVDMPAGTVFQYGEVKHPL